MPTSRPSRAARTTTSPGPRRSRGAFTVVAGVAVGALLVAAVAAVVAPAPGTARTEALFVLSWLGLPVVGGIIVARRPGNAVGAVLVAIGSAIAVGLLVNALGPRTPQPLSVGAAVVAAAGAVGGVVGFGLLPLLVLVYPHGRLEPGPWRWLGRTVVALVALTALAWVGRDTLPLPDGRMVANPISPRASAAVATAAVPVLGHALAACGVVALGRAAVLTRRASGLERLQRRWVTTALVLLVLLFVLAVGTEAVDPRLSDVLTLGAFLIGLNGVAAAIGVAILRHRLYEIDRIVSRTVTYALLTGGLVAVWSLVAVVPSLLIDQRSDLLVAAATLAVAAAFGPLRRRVQVVVDRRFARDRYDARRTVERFGARLRDEVALTALTDDLTTVLVTTLAPASVSVWLRPSAPAGHP